MSVYIDRKYLYLVSSRLEQFKQRKEDLFNFRCPICGDSRKHKYKARGYVFRKDNDYYYRCHNCNIGLTFGNFLKRIDDNSYKNYVVERYTAGETGHSNYQKPTFDELRGNAHSRLIKTDEPTPKLTSIADLDSAHYARQYVEGRGITEKFWNELYYTPNFREFMNAHFPNHGKEEERIPADDRLIMFYTDEQGNVTNVAGRSLSNSKIRYMTIKVAEGKKLFGTHRVNKHKPIIVVEGQIDSLFLDNAVASGDSSLVLVGEYYRERGLDTILAFDNEPRNKDIASQMNKAIEGNFPVVIWPPEIPEGEDINTMVAAGIDVMKVIQENVYTGLMAKLKFTDWKKV